MKVVIGKDDSDDDSGDYGDYGAIPTMLQCWQTAEFWCNVDANDGGNDNGDDGAGSQDKDDLDDHYSGSENGAGLSWEHGQLHPGLFSHHEYDYG